MEEKEIRKVKCIMSCCLVFLSLLISPFAVSAEKAPLYFQGESGTFTLAWDDEDNSSQTRGIFDNYCGYAWSFSADRKTFALTTTNIGIDSLDFMKVDFKLYDTMGLSLGQGGDSLEDVFPGFGLHFRKKVYTEIGHVEATLFAKDGAKQDTRVVYMAP